MPLISLVFSLQPKWHPSERGNKCQLKSWREKEAAPHSRTGMKQLLPKLWRKRSPQGIGSNGRFLPARYLFNFEQSSVNNTSAIKARCKLITLSFPACGVFSFFRLPWRSSSSKQKGKSLSCACPVSPASNLAITLSSILLTNPI
jgi:hypothetical protein